MQDTQPTVRTAMGAARLEPWWGFRLVAGWKMRSADCAAVRRPPSLPLDLHHLVGLGAARGDDLDLRAFFLADESARERRGDGYLALPGVGLGLADDLPNGFLFGVLVDQRDGRAEGDGFAGQFRDVDHLGARELVLKLGDAAFVERL